MQVLFSLHRIKSAASTVVYSRVQERWCASLVNSVGVMRRDGRTQLGVVYNDGTLERVLWPDSEDEKASPPQ